MTKEELIAEIRKCIEKAVNVYSTFDNTTDPEVIDSITESLKVLTMVLAVFLP